MRSLPFSLLLALAAVAACSDEQPPTSPAQSPTAVRATPTADVSSQSSPTTNLKPVDQVGFTKVTMQYGDWVTIYGGGSGVAKASCPAGATPVGGGFRLLGNGTATTRPFVSQSSLVPGTVPLSWVVEVVNDAWGAQAMQVRATILCAS